MKKSFISGLAGALAGAILVTATISVVDMVATVKKKRGETTEVTEPETNEGEAEVKDKEGGVVNE